MASHFVEKKRVLSKLIQAAQKGFYPCPDKQCRADDTQFFSEQGLQQHWRRIHQHERFLASTSPKAMKLLQRIHMDAMSEFMTQDYEEQKKKVSI